MIVITDHSVSRNKRVVTDDDLARCNDDRPAAHESPGANFDASLGHDLAPGFNATSLANTQATPANYAQRDASPDADAAADLKVIIEGRCPKNPQRRPQPADCGAAATKRSTNSRNDHQQIDYATRSPPKSMLSADGVFSRNRLMELPARCALCDATANSTPTSEGYKWRGQVFRYWRCRACSGETIHPLPSDMQLNEMYRQDRYHNVHYANAAEEVSPSMWWRAQHIIGRPGRLLDFGCGNGAFLREATQAGFDAIGIELDPETRGEAMRTSGCRVDSLDDVIASGERFDVIRLGDVLEHLPAPRDSLSQLEQLLTDGGKFFIEGPLEINWSLVRSCSRIFALLKRLRGQELLADTPPYHLTRTNARAQMRFLDRTMRYRLLYFEVSESGWPYLAPSLDRPARADALAILRPLFGHAAVITARLSRLIGLHVGNRFAAVAVPASPPARSASR